MEGPRGHDDRGCSRSTGASAHPHSHPYTLSTWWGRKVDTTLTQGKTQFNLNPPPSLLLAAGSSQRVGGCHAGERWRVNDHRRLHPASVDPSACPPTHRSINVARDWSWRGPGRLPPPLLSLSLPVRLVSSFPPSGRGARSDQHARLYQLTPARVLGMCHTSRVARPGGDSGSKRLSPGSGFCP